MSMLKPGTCRKLVCVALDLILNAIEDRCSWVSGLKLYWYMFEVCSMKPSVVMDIWLILLEHLHVCACIDYNLHKKLIKLVNITCTCSYVTIKHKETFKFKLILVLHLDCWIPTYIHVQICIEIHEMWCTVPNDNVYWKSCNTFFVNFVEL